MASVLVPCSKARKKDLKQAKPVGGPMNVAGTTANCTVLWASTLGPRGKDLAEAVLKTCEPDWARVAQLFKLAISPKAIIQIEDISGLRDGSGGAWHSTCQDNVLHVDAAFDSPALTSALWIAEFTEVLEAQQAGGWDCGAGNGEALSRVVAEWAYPGVMDGYATAGAWLDSPRTNYIDQSPGTDTDDPVNGCGVLFLWWLISRGLSLPAICQHPGATLATTYADMGLGQSAWTDFVFSVESAWPAGVPSGVTTDNPWPTKAAKPRPAVKPPGQTASQVFLVEGQAPGVYLLVPLTQRMQQVVQLNLTSLPKLQQHLATVVDAMLAALWPDTDPTQPAIHEPKEASWAGHKGITGQPAPK